MFNGILMIKLFFYTQLLLRLLVKINCMFNMLLFMNFIYLLVKCNNFEF